MNYYNLKCGDILMIEGLPFAIIDYWDKNNTHKYSLLCLNTFTTDYWMKNLDDIYVGQTVFAGVQDDGSDGMKIKAIIPKETYELEFKLTYRK